ncbi:MAG: hypothetical protein ACRC41_14075 [Sarcina sp.]
MKKKLPLSVHIANFCGGLSILGGLLTFLSGIVLGIISLVAAVIAIKKHKEGMKILILPIIGLIVSLAALILYIVVGPLH